MTYTRDPVSVAFDAAARKLLAKAYASPGQWVTIWLPDPSVRQRTRFASASVGDLTGPDRTSAVGGGGGGQDAKTRWARGFIRAIHYQHRWYSPMRADRDWRSQRRSVARQTGGLRIEVGRHVPASPRFDPAYPERGGFPPRRRVRVQLAAGGQAKARAVARLSSRDRTFTPDGKPGDRWSDPVLRDWA